MKHGKKYIESAKKIDKTKLYPLKEAVKLLKEIKFTKFDETVDICVALGIDPRQSDQIVRGMVALPNGTGKTLRVAVFARDAKADEAKKAGADVVGAEELVEEILKGNINFDRCIATPDMMGLVGRVAKVLGPKGMMPNPKLGTVTPNISAAVTAAKAGQVEFRAEKTGLVQAGLGKSSFSEDALFTNIQAFVDALNKAKPSGAKGLYMKSVIISSTMGPSIRVDMSTIA